MTLNIVIFGLSITSSWGNGHATTYRSLVRALAARGHHITFFERDVPWYREHRDLAVTPHCDIVLYQSAREIPAKRAAAVTNADLVIIGSYVPDAVLLGDWITSHARGVTAFYDIDTPVTLAKLRAADYEYVAPSLIPRFDLYLSFTGGPVLDFIEREYGSPRARALYCAADPELHRVIKSDERWALGYLGTYSADRQPGLQRLLLAPAEALTHEQFVVAGPQYPNDIYWPANVQRVDHLPPDAHAEFYCGQRFTLNLTRADMTAAGHSPSVRLFEAAACGVPIISDSWPGLNTFFTPGQEIFIAERTDEVLTLLREVPEERRRAVAAAARRRVLQTHTPDHRARQLEEYYREVLVARKQSRRAEAVA
jgi:spore maturation protein CgeB